jgi:hypothetical protein
VQACASTWLRAGLKACPYERAGLKACPYEEVLYLAPTTTIKEVCPRPHDVPTTT